MGLTTSLEDFMNKPYSIGIDVGSTTVKLVVLDDEKKIIHKEYNRHFSDIKNTFNSVDNVGNNRYVFNVKGNHYRIVAVVKFVFKRVFIRWVGNHKDYNRLKNIDKL